MTVEELVAAYVARFGREPEILWTDIEEDIREGVEEALRTGKPWNRDTPMQEGVRG